MNTLERIGIIALTYLALLSIANPVVAQEPPTEPPASREPTFEIAPRGYVQLDWRGYPDWAVATGTGRLNHDTVEVRRARFGVDGRLGRMSYEFTLDPEDPDGVAVKDAYVELRFSRAIRLRGGQFKVPGSREYQIAARSLDFMERSALAESLAAGRDIGVMLTGRAATRLRYQAGVFAGDGNGRESRSKQTAAGRVVWTLIEDLDIAGTFSGGRTSATDSDPANGLAGRTSSGYRFFDRVYVQGRRLRFGGDAEWTPRHWRLAAEALRVTDEREAQGLDYEDLPSVVGLGWSVAITRQFGRREGKARSRLREWDVSLRYDALSYDDVGPATSSDSVRPRATDIRARAAHTLTAGLSWNLARWARVIGNAALEDYSEPRSAPEPGRARNYLTFGTRLQLELP